MDGNELAQGPGGEAQPDNIAAAGELRDQLLRALQELPRHDQEAIAMCILGGLSHAEAADATGLPLNTIKARVRRALERIRKALTRHPNWREAYLALPAFLPLDGNIEAAAARWAASSRESAHTRRPFAAGRGRARTTLVGVGVLVLIALIVWLTTAFEIGRATTEAERPSASGREEDPTAGEAQRAPANRGVSAAPPSRVDRPKEAGESTGPVRRPDEHTENREKVGDVLPYDAPYPTGELLARGNLLVTETGKVNHGRFVYFHRSGWVMEEGECINGLKQGKWRRFADGRDKVSTDNESKGPRIAEGYYLNGNEDEVWTFFFPEGQPQSEGKFELGKRTGTWLDFDRTHQVTLRRMYIEGRIEGVYERFKDGRRHIVATFKSGDRDGEETEYDPATQRVIRVTNWEGGKKHGVETTFDDLGNPTTRIFEKGKPAGD